MATRRIVRTSLGPQAGASSPTTGTSTALGRMAHQLQTQNLDDPRALIALVLGNAKIEVNVPKDATLTQVEDAMKPVMVGTKRFSEALEQLKPVMGRFLLVVEERKLFRPEFPSWTEWLEKRVCSQPWGVSRTNAFEAKRIAKAYPKMQLEEYQRYGASRLLTAIPVLTDNAEENKKLLDESTRETVETFRKKVKALQSTEPQETKVVSVRLPIAVAQTWEALLEDLEMTASDVFQELLTSYVETHPGAGSEPPLLVKAAS